MTKKSQYLKRCVDLAKNGFETTAPNPMVGCVIVNQDTIIGEGWHQIYGGPHAEVNAINSVKDKSLLSQSTAYVSLEPCAHYGKTPPCAELLIKHQLRKVVIGMKDPFAEVDGKGAKMLIDAGISVEFASDAKPFAELNKRFNTFHEQKRPFVILKWAQTNDGFVDRNRPATEKASAITGPAANRLNHQWRSEETAILVGFTTALVDNPSLTTRLVEGKNPIRVVIDPQLQLPNTHRIFDKSSETLILNQIDNTDHRIKTDCSNPKTILSSLHTSGIHSIIIEGGPKTLQKFIDADLWDEARVFTSDNNLVDGIKAPNMNLNQGQSTRVGDDTYTLIENR